MILIWTFEVVDDVTNISVICSGEERMWEVYTFALMVYIYIKKGNISWWLLNIIFCESILWKKG
jgi:hypothetical protein